MKYTSKYILSERLMYCQYILSERLMYCQYILNERLMYCQYILNERLMYCQYMLSERLMYCQYIRRKSRSSRFERKYFARGRARERGVSLKKLWPSLKTLDLAFPYNCDTPTLFISICNYITYGAMPMGTQLHQSHRCLDLFVTN